jgi:hypothetical protein
MLPITKTDLFIIRGIASPVKPIADFLRSMARWRHLELCPGLSSTLLNQANPFEIPAAAHQRPHELKRI